MPKESIKRTLESGAYFIGIITNATKKSPPELLNNYQYGTYSYSYTYNTYIEKSEDSEDVIKGDTKIEKIINVLKKNLMNLITKSFNIRDNNVQIQTRLGFK